MRCGLGVRRSAHLDPLAHGWEAAMLRVTDRTRPVRLPPFVLGALWLALLALFALPAAPQATGSAHVSGEHDRMTSRRPGAREDALQTVERSGLRKLSTW